MENFTSETIFYKVTNERENHYGFQYQDGLNLLTQPFNDDPSDFNCPGGFYFSNNECIHWNYSYGIYIREITLPIDHPEFKIVQHEGKGEWRSNMIILGKRYLLSQPKTYSKLEISMINLPLACKNGYIEIVKLLLRGDQEQVVKSVDQVEHGYRLIDDSRLSEYHAALRFACRNGRTEIVELLLADGRADPKDQDSSALKEACRNGHTEIVELLLIDGRADPSDSDSLAFIFACRNGNIEMVKLLLADGRADPSDHQSAAFIFACRNGHTEIVKLLLTDGRGDPSHRHDWLIKIACENRHIKIVKLFMSDRRVDPSNLNNSALRCSSKRGYIEIVKLLLTDERVYASSKGYSSAIRLAKENDHSEIAELLKNRLQERMLN